VQTAICEWVSSGQNSRKFNNNILLLTTIRISVLVNRINSILKLSGKKAHNLSSSVVVEILQSCLVGKRKAFAEFFWVKSRGHVRAFPVVLSMWPCKTYFSHPSFSYFTFLQPPPMKLKLGAQIGWKLLIANHLDQSLWWASRKHWAEVHIIFITLFVFAGAHR
jgi:hypothetical protein